MKRLPRDEAREKRIDAEILVDAYDEEERAMGWYYYLADILNFPFQAKCIHEHHRSPLKEDHVVEVSGMAPEQKCLREVFVQVYQDDHDQELAVPLAQLEGLSPDEQTLQGLEDWQYWIGRGYGF